MLGTLEPIALRKAKPQNSNGQNYYNHYHKALSNWFRISADGISIQQVETPYLRTTCEDYHTKVEENNLSYNHKHPEKCICKH